MGRPFVLAELSVTDILELIKERFYVVLHEHSQLSETFTSRWIVLPLMGVLSQVRLIVQPPINLPSDSFGFAAALFKMAL
jgi:hypothetical protein